MILQLNFMLLPKNHL